MSSIFTFTVPSVANDTVAKWNVGGLYYHPNGAKFKYGKFIDAAAVGDVFVAASPGNATSVAPLGAIFAKTAANAAPSGLGPVAECEGVALCTVAAGSYGFLQCGALNSFAKYGGTINIGDPVVVGGGASPNGTFITAVAGTAYAIAGRVKTISPSTSTISVELCCTK